LLCARNDGNDGNDGDEDDATTLHDAGFAACDGRGRQAALTGLDPYNYPAERIS